MTTAAEQVLPDQLARFRAEHPHVTVHLQVTDSRAVWGAFTAHGADVVLAGRPPASIDGAVTRGLRPNRLLAVAAPHVGDSLERTTWLMREAGSGTRATMEALLEAQELRPPLLNMGSSGAVITGAVAGLGIALVSEDAVHSHLEQGALRVVDVPELPLSRPWHLVTRTEPPATAELFTQHLLTPGGHFRVVEASPSLSTSGGSTLPTSVARLPQISEEDA